jgi:hypothetical protein
MQDPYLSTFGDHSPKENIAEKMPIDRTSLYKIKKKTENMDESKRLASYRDLFKEDDQNSQENRITGSFGNKDRISVESIKLLKKCIANNNQPV